MENPDRATVGNFDPEAAMNMLSKSSFSHSTGKEFLRNDVRLGDAVPDQPGGRCFDHGGRAADIGIEVARIDILRSEKRRYMAHFANPPRRGVEHKGLLCEGIESSLQLLESLQAKQIRRRVSAE